jgi:hypothetical protein
LVKYTKTVTLPNDHKICIPKLPQNILNYVPLNVPKEKQGSFPVYFLIALLSHSGCPAATVS